jgi:hypothetical protein
MYKVRENNWKLKGIERSKLLKVVNKELVRQTARANRWREESYTLRRELKRKDLLIKELQSINPTKFDPPPATEISLSGYKYGLSVIYLSVSLYQLGLSFRTTSSVLSLFFQFSGLPFSAPSYGTISVWVQKQGLYLLEQGNKVVKNSSDRWCLIVDESFSLGKSRLMVVLGVRLNSLLSGRALNTRDVVPLVIRSRAEWKADDVSTILTEATEKVGGSVAYMLSDQGTNLVCAAKQNQLAYIPDWSHYSANILKNCYAEDADFKLFNEKMGAFKKKRKQSIYTYYSPPNLSVKVRFMNYIPFLEWANTILSNFVQIPAEIVEELRFLQNIRLFIIEMTDLFYTVREIGVLLKKEGINHEQSAKAIVKLTALQEKYPNNLRVANFVTSVKEYFAITLPIYDNYALNMPKDTPFFDALLASSDIIESIFGKFKHRASKNPKKGFSANCLIIPLFCKQFSPYEVLNAMQKVSCIKLEKWKNKNLCNRKYFSFRNIFDEKAGSYSSA